jgi:Arc/MetJ-type ribon-helix-helix transcriptional regulator
MTPVNVKLDQREVDGLDAAISHGLANNRSDAIRIALKRQIRDWERQRIDEAWAKVVPSDDDEFGELNDSAKAGWSDLDSGTWLAPNRSAVKSGGQRQEQNRDLSWWSQGTPWIVCSAKSWFCRELQTSEAGPTK